jgi:hypothetical protein
MAPEDTPAWSARGAREKGAAKMTEEKILTKHPLGKSGRKYQQAQV